MIPATLWTVFSAGWLETKKAPPDAPHWQEQGYLTLTAQGKLTGYVITPATYGWIVGGRAHV